MISYVRNSNFSINKKNVIQIVKDVRDLIFPNFFNSLSSKAINANIFFKERIGNLLRLELGKINENTPFEIDIDKVIKDFFIELDDVVEFLKLDLQTFYNSDPAATDYDEIVISYPGYFAIYVYRIANVLYRLNVPYIPRIMSEYAHSKTGIDIHPGAEIDSNFFIDHGTGIVIGETTKIGKNVKIYQNVTLGAISLGRGQLLKGVKRHPTIENNVTIYSGATILGGETVVGENTTIGANSFILESVSPNSIVLMKKSDLEFIKKTS